MSNNVEPREIVKGVHVDERGHVSTSSHVARVLFDLALKLESKTPFPVDVEHVLAAVVLAERAGEFEAKQELSADDTTLLEVLEKHLRSVFGEYGGAVGEDD